MAGRRKKAASARGGNRPGLIAVTLLCVLLIPALQVWMVRYLDPPVTTVMFQRAWQHPDWPREYLWQDLEAYPERLLWFVILSEDGRFFDHRGIDWKEMNRVVAAWQEAGTPPRGASTITMQTARSLFLWQGRSYVRKGLEIYYTFWLELLLDKRRILELYLNVIETAPGVYGLAAGAEYHYDRPLEKTTAHQQARLVAILPNPLEWSARSPSRTVKIREARILKNSKLWRRPSALSKIVETIPE